MCFSIFKKKVKPMLKSEMSSSEVWDLIRVMGLDIDTKKVNFAMLNIELYPIKSLEIF